MCLFVGTLDILAAWYSIAGDKTSVYLIICMNGWGVVVEIEECLTIWEVRRNIMGV